MLPDACATHAAPPVLVATTVPPAPAAHPWAPSAKATARRSRVVPELCAVQTPPPLLVATTAPPAPTAQAVFTPLQATP